jgi:hypothetical protein
VCLGFDNADFKNYWLPVGNQRPLLASQRGEQRQLHSLHCGFDAAQGMSAQHDLVRGEDQAKLLLLSVALEFGEGELVERQEDTLFSR